MNPYKKKNLLRAVYSAIILVTISSTLVAQNQISLAGAGPDGCKTNPNKNAGVCKKNVNGEEYNCVVKDYSWDDADCYSD